MNARILIVDDSPTVRMTMEWLLANSGFATAVAADGLEALAVIPDFKPEIILLDIFMPGCNGVQITKVIRGKLDLDTPIIMITGQAGMGDIQQALLAGANGYLRKPVLDSELLTVIDSFVGMPRGAA